MNQAHHHHPGVSIGQLPIGMVTAHGSGAPLGIGIGIPIMTSGQLQQMVHAQPRNNGHNSTTHNTNMVSPDSSDDGHRGHRSHSPMNSTRHSPHSISSSNPLSWQHGSLLQPIAGMGYPVMGMGVMGPSHLGEPGMLYGINLISQGHGHGHPAHGLSAPVQPPTPEIVHHSHAHNHNPVLANPAPCNATPAVASPGLPPAAIPMSPTGISGVPALQPPATVPAAGPSKEIIHCKSCTLFPPNPSAPPPTTRDKPPGCRTVFVGGLPENATDETVREIFDRCGDITTIRMSKKNFCHIRFELESFVENAIYLSGYRVRIGSNSDAANIGRFHVDYAQARDDLFEWECRQRQLMRELRHRERLEQERLLPPSPPPVVHYSEHEAVNLLERIKVEESFMKAVQVLITWLDRGDCNKRNATNFYSMVQSTNSHIRRLLTEKGQYEDELKKAKALGRQRMQGLLAQFSQIEKVFLASCHKKVWDHFTKAQRKNIDAWKKQAIDIKNTQLEEALNDRTDEEMDLSDSENEHNESDDSVPRPKKIRLEDDNKNLNQLKEENDSLRCQLEAFKNEVDLIKADLKTEMELKDDQLRDLRQQLLATRPAPSGSSPTQSDSEISASRPAFFSDSLIGDANRSPETGQPRCDSTQPVLQSPPSIGNGNSTESESTTSIAEREAKLIAVISTFLHIHPFGASLDYIWSYAQKIVATVTPSEIQSVMVKYPSLFRQELSGVGATLERKWTFGGFTSNQWPNF